MPILGTGGAATWQDAQGIIVDPFLDTESSTGTARFVGTVGHLIEADRRGFAGRVRAAVAEVRPTFTPWDQPGVALERRDQEKNPADLVAVATIGANLQGLGDFTVVLAGDSQGRTGYVRELDAMIAAQSAERDPEKRRKIAWEIDRKLQEDMARPILFHYAAATCWAPQVHGIVPMVNSIYNSPRMDDVWLDR